MFEDNTCVDKLPRRIKTVTSLLLTQKGKTNRRQYLKTNRNVQ